MKKSILIFFLSIMGICAVTCFQTPANQVAALGNSAQDIRLQNQLNALVAGVTDDAARYNLIKDPLINAVNTWYKAPAATAAVTVKPYKVTLKTLKCFTTEDNTGADESSLRIYVDGSKVATFNKDLNDGNKL